MKPKCHTISRLVIFMKSCEISICKTCHRLYCRNIFQFRGYACRHVSYKTDQVTIIRNGENKMTEQFEDSEFYEEM